MAALRAAIITGWRTTSPATTSTPARPRTFNRKATLSGANPITAMSRIRLSVVYRSPYPDVAIPELSFSDHVLGRARERGTRTALIDGPSGRRLTYAELAAAVGATAAGLHRRGLQAGEVAAI